jgi:hypothetical protein
MCAEHLHRGRERFDPRLHADRDRRHPCRGTADVNIALSFELNGT